MVKFNKVLPANSIPSEQKSLSFLNDILRKSDNFIFFLIPAKNTTFPVDFKLEFITQNVESIIKKPLAAIQGKNLSEVFPVIYENGISEILVSCFEKEGLEIPFERELRFCDKKIWLQCNAIRYDNGIVVTARDITTLKESERKLRELNRQLDYQNTILKDAEMISKTASFRWNITKKKWIFSNNIKNLFDLTPENEHLLEEGIFGLMNTADRDELKKLIQAHKYDDQLPSFNFISKFQGSHIKHYTLTGNFVPTLDGQMMLGVLKDITQIVLDEQILVEKNQQLLRSNEELDSFNHIASHDLQEPLRKIRMFISRVNSMDQSDISEKSRAFLLKIEDSADRMQSLIRHLLTYSRIGKTEVVFEKVDLRVVIKELIHEFDERIANTNSSIVVGHLPVIIGIPFLVKQLFFNIISNALKYTKPGVPPEILIKSQKVPASKLKSLTIKSRYKSYMEISCSDNGIGFKQEYAEKIFLLFQRLHQKTEYSGTGIGLAICQKIMNTHEGFILAKSTKGEGAQFFLYFPVKDDGQVTKRKK
ncbi:ATP-binding protein [Aquimarina sp. ERC-38]|uniref:sensor histidine kinase n=1 Tax=Aquimarina sp. ERC-38 TaxID=2949996 RepID=UPI002246AEFC|nr:ATP-binding protein [Aquimarina sp. ERC-38]UZO81121.1 ATP-binding protein [Aquimarina sp. ERC-38]